MKILESDPDLLRAVFDYDDGNLLWKIKPFKRIRIGDVAGCIMPIGYIKVAYQKTDYYNHRLIYIYHHGIIPDGLTVDHKSRIRILNKRGTKAYYNNRIDNLRLATQSEQNYNQGMHINNTSGYKGVSWNKTKNHWQASIAKDGKEYKKSFKTLNEAIAWRQAMEIQLHGEFIGDLFTT